jgi:hypothetical protein
VDGVSQWYFCAVGNQESNMAIEVMSYRRVTLPGGRMASGHMSIIQESGRLEGVRLRVEDQVDGVCEYLAKTNGRSFRSVLTGEMETRPEMLAVLRETFEQWHRASSL